ncbi:MAG: hypothetical protein JEY79_00320 [Pseudodesulfovibrio sp.]|nr:hypothetical protein [Pseudodesulfovibrio sp.]
MRPEGKKPTLQALNGLAKAFDLMKYDIGLLAQSEADVFHDAGATSENWRKTEEIVPFTIIKSSNGDKIGFLRFPSLPKGEDIPSGNLIKKISKAVKNEQNNVRLIVGLSDWGWVGEREYLAQNPDFVPDFLFGSGRGSGVTGRIEANGRCAWVRPYDKGRTVSEVLLFGWPERSASFAWKELGNFKALSIGLGDQYHDNPDVSAILQ